MPADRKFGLWSVINAWNGVLPAEESKLKSHFALATELAATFATLWEEVLGPASEAKLAKARKKS